MAIETIQAQYEALKREYQTLYNLSVDAVETWQHPLAGKLDLELKMVSLRQYLNGE